MHMEPNALSAQQLSPLALSNMDSLQEVLDEENDRKLTGYVNKCTEFFENINQLQRKRRRQGPHTEPLPARRGGDGGARPPAPFGLSYITTRPPLPAAAAVG
jgi:hypothetical protein